MKRNFPNILPLLVMVVFGMVCNSLQGQATKNEADKVIRRFIAGNDLKVKTKLVEAGGNPAYKASVEDGMVHIEGNTPIAICRGFYDLVRKNGAGIDSWTGRRFDVGRLLSSDCSLTACSPYKNRYFLNVVTYGYTMPYWDEKRWDAEIDMMALHGYDMPLMLLAQEAIMLRVFKKQGLSEKEINEYFVGPAHLPWMRMGNISGIDSPLTASWHKGQLRLAHHVLGRMRKLGMTPICPGFSGFVPKAMQRVHPEMEIKETSWCGGAFHNWMVSPDQSLFKTLEISFIKEWQKEFGPCSHYLVDSFNEMELPFAPHNDPRRYAQLASYGKAVYESIAEAAPEAVWTMMGWMFGYQRHIWDNASLKALLREVPDDKMLLLDLAVDYNYLHWRSGPNWEYYDGFFNKPWTFSVIPNMGGKNPFTGFLNFYANQGRLDALSSAKRGKLAAYGYAAEGLESNELIYELVTDGGWTSDPIDTDAWLTNYQQCRYGSQLVSNSCWRGIYNNFIDHPSFIWQTRPGTRWKGSVWCIAEAEKWIKEASLPTSSLAKADYAEVYATMKGGEIEKLLVRTDSLITAGAKDEAEITARKAFSLMKEVDARIAADIPSRSLKRWVDYARRWGTNEKEKDAYAKNARRIVSIWGPPVDDYSCRVWSGLISDYYLPRWQLWFKMRMENKTASEISYALSQWEHRWVEGKQ